MSAGRAILADAGRKLDRRWQELREVWRDRNAESFEKRYMQPIASASRSAAMAMDELDDVAQKARRACE